MIRTVRMRWHVEVTPIGKTDAQSIVVDAESWQKALQMMRAMRGDNGPMSGFSIELLDTGYRAVDPMARLVYVVKRAEDAPLHAESAPASPEPSKPPPSIRPPAASARAPAPRPQSVPAPAPHASTANTKDGAPQTVALGASAAPEATVANAPAPAPLPPATTTSVAEPDEPARTVPSATPSVGEDDATYIDRRLPGADPAPSPGDVPPTQVIFKREEDPTASVPLTYREYVYAVATGTTEEDAERVLLAQFELVKRALEGARRGKLVNLAVYDAIFRGRPTVSPVATLAWKDWKGSAPVIEFPRRQPARSAERARASAPVLTAAAPALTPAPSPRASSPSDAALTAAASALPSANAPLAPAPTPGPGPTDRPSNAGTRVARPSAERGRVKGDELIAALFEAMHDLHFLRDAIEGGDFCLSLALEMLPASGGLVHLYDIDRREFVVTCTTGKGAERLLLTRSPESEALLLAAMHKRRALVVSDAGSREEAAAPRYAPFGGARHLLIAPVLYGGRFIGAIELVNTTDNGPFTEDEGNALSYIAEQYAEYVTQRGIVLDAERISQRSGALRAR